MPRTLRARKSLPNYASIVGIEDDANEAGPSTLALDDSSGSDFTPETETKSRKSQGVDVDEGGELSDEELPEVLATAPSRVKSRGRVRKGKGPISVVKSTIPKPTTLSGNFRRQMYILPTPSVHHRHRAVPLYSVPGRVERLVSRPNLFSTSEVVLTNNFTMNATIIDRLNKAWGYNVGSGPMWELVEDRGWFKEAQGLMESERNRRPKVHENVSVLNGWTFLDAECVRSSLLLKSRLSSDHFFCREGSTYLPTDDILTEEGNFRAPSPISCYFGPFGSQTARTTRMLSAFKMGVSSNL